MIRIKIEELIFRKFGLTLFLFILFIGIFISIVLFFFTNSSGFVTVIVPSNNIPAYHLIESSDLITQTFFTLIIPDNVIRNSSDAIGKYTLVPLKKNNYFKTSMLGNITSTTNLTDTICVGLSIPYEDFIIANVSTGDNVDIYLVQNSENKTPIVLKNITILDVKELQENNSADQFVAIISIPIDDMQYYINVNQSSQIKIVKSIEQ